MAAEDGGDDLTTPGYNEFLRRLAEVSHVRSIILSLAACLASPIAAFADEFDIALHAYDACMVAALVRFKDLCEPADQVATAIVGSCPDELWRLTTFMSQTIGMDKASRLANDLKSKRKDYTMGLLLEYRLEHPCPR